MDSQQAAGMQLKDSMSGSWTEAAYQVVQDISAVLLTGRDDVQPMNDAPNYQVLCAAASQACSQAEHSMCSSASQQAVSTLHLKDIECLCQLSTATLQLSSAVCCDPAVALPLVSAGTRNPALEQLKEAVKSLTSMWTACMIRLQQQDVHAPAGDSEYAGHPAGSQHAWQCLIPSLAASVRHLLHMSVTSADFLSGTSSSSQQTEMCSMAALNLSWANLTRLLVAVPDDVRPQVLEAHELLHGLQCACQQLHTAVAELPVHGRKRQDTLVRFWLQSVSRLTSAVWEGAARQALQPLLQVTLEVFDLVVQQRQEFDTAQDILQDTLQPRLLACLSSLLSSSSDPAIFQAKLDVLLQHPAASAHMQDSQQQQQQQQQPRQQAMAQLYVVLAILQEFLPSWPQELVAVGCKQLLCWTVSNTGQELTTFVLGASAAADGRETGQQKSRGLVGEAAGLELTQGVLQGCLVGVMVCWGMLQDMQQQQLELLVALISLALTSHPVTSFLGRQLLADLIAAAGSSVLAEQQLGLLHTLLGASAAAAAMPGAGWEATFGADAVVDTIAMVLQACDADFAAHWLKQHVMLGLGGGSSSPWLDAGACALLAQESALLQRLVGAAPQFMPASQAQLQEAWTQLWSTAQQVAELLEPQHLKQLQQQPGSSSGNSSTQQHAVTRLILQQLAWLLKAMQGILQLFSMVDPAAAASLKQEAAELMLDILKSLAESCVAVGSEPPTQAAAAAAQYACTIAVLELLAVPGQLLLPEVQTHALLAVLTELGQQHEGLHAVLAGVLGSLGPTAKAGNHAYRELFQQLILSPQWAVRHAAYDALLQLLRHGDLANGILTLLPPALKVSPTSAVPEVIATVKAHLQKQPDAQALASFAQHYPQTAKQHMQLLAAHAASCGSSHDSSTTAVQQPCSHVISSSSLPDADALSSSVQELQGLLTISGVSAAAAMQGGRDDAETGSPGARPLDTVAGKAPMYADGVGGAQALLAQAAAAAKGLQAADKALSAAESEVQLLMTAAAAAARGQALGADGILLISKQGSSLMGNVASMISRLRALQDGLSTLRQ